MSYALSRTLKYSKLNSDCGLSFNKPSTFRLLFDYFYILRSINDVHAYKSTKIQIHKKNNIFFFIIIIAFSFSTCCKFLFCHRVRQVQGHYKYTRGDRIKMRGCNLEMITPKSEEKEGNKVQ